MSGGMKVSLRMRLSARIIRDDQTSEAFHALNEIVVDRGELSYRVRYCCLCCCTEQASAAAARSVVYPATNSQISVKLCCTNFSALQKGNCHPQHAYERYTVFDSRVQCCTVLHSTALYCTAPHRTVLYCTPPHCIVLHSTALYILLNTTAFTERKL